MALIELSAKKWRHRLTRESHAVSAVLDADLWAILQDFHLLEPLDAGELTCYTTGVQLTRDNLGGIVVTPEGPRLIADQAFVAR